jgi:hypothetical protein
MTEFSQQTARYLNRAGWTPDYVVDISNFEKLLRDSGFHLNNAALRFLEEFGGLHIQYPHAKVADIADNMHFDIPVVIRHITPSNVEAYGRIVGSTLCPIGEAARGYFILMMAECGGVYGAYGDFFVKVGASGVEAIETLCSGKELMEIPVPDDW